MEDMPKPPTPSKTGQPFSLRLDDDSVLLLESIAGAMGIGRSDVVRVALRVLAKQQGVDLPIVPPPPKGKR